MRTKSFSFCLMLLLLFGFCADPRASDTDLSSFPNPKWIINSLLSSEIMNLTLVGVQPTLNVSASNKASAGTGAISGRVTKASGGDPIPNVVVTALQIDCPHRSYADTTGTDGYYIMDELPCGKYSVRTGIDSIYVDLYWNNKYLWEMPDPVTVSNNTTENINFSLRLGGRITGSITLSGSFFVLLTFVFAVDTTHGTAYYDMPVSLGGTASYSIEGLPTGVYKLRTFNLLGYIDTYYNNKSSWVTADLVSVTEGGTTSSKNFSLNQGGKIEGNVSSAVSGPLDSALVLGILLADTLEWFQVAFTNASGNYSLAGLRSGYWKVFALGDTINAFEFYNDKDGWSSADSILVTSPSTVTDKNFSLETGGSISGHVYDSEGNLLSNTTVAAYESSLVQLLLQEGIPLLSQVGFSFRQSTTLGDGSYRITGLRTGSYYLKASSECDYQWYDHQDSLEEGDLVHVTMPNDASGINFDLPTLYTRGDMNGDEVVDIGDVIYLINYLYKNGCAPYPSEAGDANCDTIVDVGDVVFLINYLFKGGAAPSC